MDRQNLAKAMDQLSMLFQAFPASTDKTSPATAKAYLIAIEGATYEAISAGVRAIIRGESSFHAGKFVPSTAELAKAVRFEEQMIEMRARRAAMPRVEHKIEPDVVLTPEQRARRVEAIKRLVVTIGEKALEYPQDGDMGEKVA